MVNRNYQAGRKFEYEVKKYFEELGYLTFRTAGSHGLADIIALKDDSTLIVQCKYGTMPTKNEINKMWEYHWKKFGMHITVLLAHRNRNEKLKLYRTSFKKGNFLEFSINEGEKNVRRKC